MTIHDFDASLARGQHHETILDRYFATQNIIVNATPDEERRGIDRWFTSGDTQTAVQYKADERAANTHNVFIEVAHVGPKMLAKGWAYTCQADVIVYWIVGTRNIYKVRPSRILDRLQYWWRSARRYPLVRATNHEYSTLGLLIPVEEFAGLAYESEQLPGWAFRDRSLS